MGNLFKQRTNAPSLVFADDGSVTEAFWHVADYTTRPAFSPWFTRLFRYRVAPADELEIVKKRPRNRNRTRNATAARCCQTANP